jgi:methionyl-tRNA synthetase
MGSFFLTTAIDYVNSRPHLGTAYEKITADVIARYHRLKGDRTWFLMGNDEHSQNVYKRALEQGKEPLAYCDEMEQVFRDVWGRLDISFDDFIRTSDRRRHFPAVQQMAQACLDRGDIYEGTYEGHYCVGCEEFKPEKELIDGQCPVHKTRPEWIRERNWFFRLSRYQQPLLDLYRQQPSFIEPDVRRNEVLRFVEGGLDDLSMSRAGQSWGIPLPFDPKSVVYVWFDALINYAAAVGYGWDEARFREWWPASLHIVGKDITRFHCVIWPAMLMSAGLPLPGQVFGHGWVFFKGERMSKSLGNMVDPLDAARRFGPDPLRLYLTKEVPYGGDGDFTWERFEEKYNADLANNLGNLVNRVAAMTERYRGGRLPAPMAGPLTQLAADTTATYRGAMDRLALHDGVAAAYRLVSGANEYIADTQPWALAKDETKADRLTQVLAEAAEAVRIAAVLLSPVMPTASQEIARRMGDLSGASWRLDTDAAWRASGERTVTNSGALWPRLDDKGAIHVSDTSAQVPATPAAATPTAVPSAVPAATPDASAAPVEATPVITIDDFMKVHLKVARVLEAERVPKSKKLVRLRVDAGEAAPRQILAGIAESYEPEALVGRSIVIVANLAPRMMMGMESNGMVLAASPDGGGAIVLNAEPAAPGTRVR